MEVIRLKMRIANVVKELGPEEAIRVIDNNISSFPMMSTTHLECHELLKKAKRLIEEGKFDELTEVDRQIESLAGYDMWE